MIKKNKIYARLCTTLIPYTLVIIFDITLHSYTTLIIYDDITAILAHLLAATSLGTPKGSRLVHEHAPATSVSSQPQTSSVIPLWSLF